MNSQVRYCDNIYIERREPISRWKITRHGPVVVECSWDDNKVPCYATCTEYFVNFASHNPFSTDVALKSCPLGLVARMMEALRFWIEEIRIVSRYTSRRAETLDRVDDESAPPPDFRDIRLSQVPIIRLQRCPSNADETFTPIQPRSSSKCISLSTSIRKHRFLSRPP